MLLTAFEQRLQISKDSSRRPYCTAVALAERPAKSVSFQRIAPSHPLTGNDDSVALAVLPAEQFSGSIANFAFFAVKNAFCEHITTSH